MKKSVIEYLVETERRFPEKVAVRDREGEITFHGLLNSAFVIADELRGLQAWKQPVGVYIPKGRRMIEAFAGINMSGNFYVPLDTKSPDTRVGAILETLEAGIVVTDAAHEERARHLGGVRTVLVIDGIVARRARADADAAQYLARQIDTDAVYAIFTSGSTGKPKGVVIAHRGVIDFTDWAVSAFGFDHTMVIGNQTPFYFDMSILDIYTMYATGATLDIIPETNFAFPARLIDYLNEHRINFVFWVPFVLKNVANFDILKDKKPLYLKDVFFAGEAMPNRQLNYWRRHLPQCRYANLYGPTEITNICTYYIVDREFSDDEPVPIGFPCRNCDVIILNERNEPAKTGERGEICVRGTALALGYYNDWDKTRAAFTQNPLNSHYPELIYHIGDIGYRNERGEIILVGRKDAQIKHNGYRIELGEIENAAIATGLVDSCCAVYDFKDRKIVLFYQSPAPLDIREFRTALETKIPRYMVPGEFVRERAIRKNANGKTDRAYYKEQINK